MELVGLGILLLGVLGIVIFFARGVFSRDLTSALKRVTQQEQALQEKADILEQRLNQMEREYQAKLKRADTEAERLVQEAKNQAMNVRTAAIEEAKHRARQLLLEAEQGKVQLKVDVTRELNGKVVHRACEVLRAFLPPEQLSMLHGMLMKELLDALKRLDTTTFRATVDRVEVMSAQSIDSADSLRLAQWAAAAVGAEVPIRVETDPALVAGCVVRVGPTIVDGSLANRLQRQG